MFKYLQHLYARWWLRRVRKQLDAVLRSKCDVVEIEVGNLTLTSFDPEKKRLASVNGEEVEFFHSFWDGKAYFPFWGGKLHISLSVDGPRPQPHELDTVRSILDYPTSIRAAVESSLFDYYRSNIYHQQARDDEGKPLPEPSDHKRIRAMLAGPTVHLDEFREEAGPLTFTLEYACDWDDEHGVSVEVHDWKVASVGI